MFFFKFIFYLNLIEYFVTLRLDLIYFNMVSLVLKFYTYSKKQNYLILNIILRQIIELNFYKY